MHCKVIGVLFILFWIILPACRSTTPPNAKSDQELASFILADNSLKSVERMARELLGHGFQAGKDYPQIWIRDLNTFIETSCEVTDRREIRKILLAFYSLQQKNGEILDAIVSRNLGPSGLGYYAAPADSRYKGFKNTVKSDQETSLIQAVGKYINKTADRSILDTRIAGKTVRDRMASSIEYLLKYRYSPPYGLITSATTLDWGDIQPEDNPGTQANEKTHWCCDIYTNAMFIIALDTLIKFSADPAEKLKWSRLKERIFSHTRKYLWDSQKNKFLPHLYLNGSPFPSGFDEKSIYFLGGTAVAIEAGLLSRSEIVLTNRQMLENVRRSGAPSIGLTIYPPYPKGFFKNEQSAPYTYQNGGDWSWFGGRMIQQLIANGFVREAYTELRPMIARVIKDKGFYEWYGRTHFEINRSGIRWYGAGGKPEGSGHFRGAAGVLAKVIRMLREWAIKESGANTADR